MEETARKVSPAIMAKIFNERKGQKCYYTAPDAYVLVHNTCSLLHTIIGVKLGDTPMLQAYNDGIPITQPLWKFSVVVKTDITDIVAVECAAIYGKDLELRTWAERSAWFQDYFAVQDGAAEPFSGEKGQEVYAHLCKLGYALPAPGITIKQLIDEEIYFI